MKHQLQKKASSLLALALAGMMMFGCFSEVLSVHAEEIGWEAFVENVEASDPQQEEAALPACGTVTGFDGLEESVEIQASVSDRPSQEELLEKMPASIPVYIDQSETPAQLPVTWYCISGDYEEATQYYYQFSPQWDTEAYPLAEGLDPELDAPDVGVFFNEEEGITTLGVAHSGNEAKVYQFITQQMKLNCAAAAGIMANIQAESGFSPKAVNNGSTSFHGICQWGQGGSSGNRWSKLKQWCAKKGYSSQSLTGQLKYMEYELNTVDGYRLSTLKKTSNSGDGAYSAAKTFAKYFEGCPATYHKARQRLAKGKYWKDYSPLAKAKITVLEEDSIYYNGKAQKPEIKLVTGSKTLTAGKDYQLSYSNNVEAGTAELVVSGAGKYCGMVVESFTIQTRAPEMVSATAVASGVKVSWEAAAGAAKYRLYRKDSEGWVKVKDTANLSCVDPDARSGEVNTYSVRCISTDGEIVSDYARPTMSIRYVAAPKLTLSAVSSGVKVKWPAVSGAAQYTIFRQNSNEEWEEVKTTSSTSWTDKEATACTGYTYRAVSLSEEGEKLSCNGAAVTLNRLPPPVLKSASSVKTGIKITWEKVAGSAKYRVYRKKDGSWVKLADTTSASWTDTTVKKGTKYVYTVCCIGKDGKTIQSTYNASGVNEVWDKD